MTSTVAPELLDRARAALDHAWPRVSDFAVGAALRTAAGAVFTGVNIESPSLLQVFCAERVALVKALSEGHRAFTHLAIVAAQRAPIEPCGLCRQMLWEFAPDIVVIAQDGAGTIIERPLRDYLPLAFSGPSA